MYQLGSGVPKNYFCALEWYLKSAQQNNCPNAMNNIGDLFENGHGVPLNKYKALEWYCHTKEKTYKEILKNQGYHRSGADKSKFSSTIASIY